jgi:hypothetical protein
MSTVRASGGTMDQFEIISLRVYRFIDRHILEVRFRQPDGLAAPGWGSYRVYDLQPASDSVLALLMTISEEVFNHADEIAGAAARAATPASTSGGHRIVDDL